MRKVYKKILVLLVIISLIIQNFTSVGLFSMDVSGATTKKLKAGDWLYLQTRNGTVNWQDGNANIYFYAITGKGDTNYLMEKVDDNFVRVKIPEGVTGFIFRRVNPAAADQYTWEKGQGLWNRYPADGYQIYLSDAPNNTNTFVMNDWNSGAWASEGTWQISGYGGSTLYFKNMDLTAAINGLKAEFYVSSTGATNEVSMTLQSDGTYSVVIPEGLEYDYVKFKDGNGTVLDDVAIMDGTYEPDTDNTYYYRSTIKADGTHISGFKDKFTGTGSIAGKTLYLSDAGFVINPSKLPTIKLGDGQEVTINGQDDGYGNTVYKYTIPSSSAATRQTIITIKNLGNTYNFMWEDLDKDEVNIESTGMAEVSGKYVAATGRTITVYYDANLSYLPYTEAASGKLLDYGIPNSQGTIRYYATGSGLSDIEGSMEYVANVTSENGTTYGNVYRVKLPAGYTNIVFSSFDMYDSTNYGGHGESTTTLTVPTNMSKPCFYADSSDKVIYDGGQRGGYWDELGSVRSPEHNNNEVVDIPSGTFTREDDTFYVGTKFYDYYSDYELNGDNRDGYKDLATYNHRIYQPFRQLNTALSDYYKNNSVNNPLYWGNFQNYSGIDSAHFSEISSTMNLYGSNDTKKLFFQNNSMWDCYGNELSAVPGGAKGQYATMGLVSNSLTEGNLAIETSKGNIAAPFFDDDYLTGKNIKNTELAKVYDRVLFPFTKKPQTSKSEPTKTGTVDYWQFDSADSSTALRLKKDSQIGYFLDPSTSTVQGTTTDGATTSGNFLPFNGSEQSGNSAKLNYGFGMKMEFNFRLTDTGTVLTSNNEAVPIEFNFAGDDDIWIFIDDELALDLGGDHGAVTGRLNFRDLKYTISAVKNTSSAGFTTNKTERFKIKGKNSDNHKLTLYYMERGLWESNMKISFNFPDQNYFEIDKKVDVSGINTELFNENIIKKFGDINFDFEIMNYATHFGEVLVGDDNAEQNTGFIKKQYDIPSYGSVTAGRFVYPEGAKFTKTVMDADGNGTASQQTVPSSGRISLTDGDSAVFYNQFRRGSYLSLKEKIPESFKQVFDTTYTMYEDNELVNVMNTGRTVELGSNTNQVNVQSLEVDDGRAEVHTNEIVENNNMSNSGYTSTKKPDGSSFVFRSYSNPDSTTMDTRIKVVYNNKVKTGSVTISKDKAYDVDELNGEYTFTIKFYNVAGNRLEDSEIVKTVVLKCGESTTIEGIPYGTEYTITETASDTSVLHAVTKDGTDYKLDDSKVVTGKVDRDTVAYVYKNTEVKETSIAITKVDATDNSIKIANVEFVLEKLETSGSVDSTFTPLEVTTDTSGKAVFEKLKDGTYRLTETNTNSNYSLLKEPILIVINRKGTSTINGDVCTVTDDTISLTISNRRKFELPSTGGNGRTIIILSGILFIWFAGLIYIFEKNYKKRLGR